MSQLASSVKKQFVVVKTLTSSDITTTAELDITSAATGEITVEDVIVKTDDTGLASSGSAVLQISTDNDWGGAVIFSDAVANLGSNVTLDLDNAGTTGIKTVLEDGKKVYATAKTADFTGDGQVKVYVYCSVAHPNSEIY